MDIVLVHAPCLHLLSLLYFSEFKCFAIKKHVPRSSLQIFRLCSKIMSTSLRKLTLELCGDRAFLPNGKILTPKSEYFHWNSPWSSQWEWFITVMRVVGIVACFVLFCSLKLSALVKTFPKNSITDALQCLFFQFSSIDSPLASPKV